MDAERDNGGTISTAHALDPCAGVGAHGILRRFCSTLSTRRTTVAGVEYLRPADARVDSQFYFSSKYQLRPDYRHPPLRLGRRDHFSASWRPEPMGSEI